MAVREIERQGVLKGYVRADEVWKFAVETLNRSRDVNGRIKELTGFDIKKLETTLEQRAETEGAGREPGIAEKVRSHYISELWRIRDEKLSIAGAVAVHRLFLRNDIKVWHQPDVGTERYLLPEEFRVADTRPGGTYGQTASEDVALTPYNSWMTGAVSLNETNGGSDDRLYGKTLMVSESDIEKARQSLTRDYPPTALALAADERLSMIEQEVERLHNRKLWDVLATVGWVAYRDLRQVAEIVVDWKAGHSLTAAFVSAPTALIDIRYLDESNDASAYLPSRQLLDALLNEVDLGATGRFLGESHSKSLTGVDAVGRHFCGGTAGEFIGAMSQIGPGEKVTQADITAVSFDRQKVMSAFPTPAVSSERDAVEGGAHLILHQDRTGTGDKPSWHRKEYESKSSWLLRQDVREEAFLRSGIEDMRKSYRALADMAQEGGFGGWTHLQIGANWRQLNPAS